MPSLYINSECSPASMISLLTRAGTEKVLASRSLPGVWRRQSWRCGTLCLIWRPILRHEGHRAPAVAHRALDTCTGSAAPRSGLEPPLEGVGTLFDSLGAPGSGAGPQVLVLDCQR